MTKINKEGWEIKKLGEVCAIERGGSPRPIQNFITDSDDGLNWIKIGDAVEGSKYITKTAEKIIPEGLKKTRWVEKGDFILSNSMSFGRPYILDIDGCIHDGWLVIHGVEDNFNKDFLYYYLSSPIVYAIFKKMAVGGVVNNLNSKMVRDLNVPIPERIIQQRIVEELDEINAIISAKKEQLSKLDELAQSIFYNMFGDPFNNVYGFAEKTLGELTNEKMAYGSMASAIDYDGHTRYIRITDICDNGTLQAYKVSPSTIDNKYKLQEGDIVFARSGATVGKTYLHSKTDEECIYAGYLIKFVPNQELVLPLYVFHFTKTKYYEKFIEKTARAVAQPNINAKQYGELKIILPPLPLQETFAARVSAIEEQKSSIAASIEKMQTLLNERMQEYFG